MKVLLFYRQDHDYDREIREYLHDFQQQMGKELPTMSPDSPEGMQLAALYDIVEYPTIIALDNNGQLIQMWRGLPLPKMSEVSYYAQEN